MCSVHGKNLSVLCLKYVALLLCPVFLPDLFSYSSFSKLGQTSTLADQLITVAVTKPVLNHNS